MNVHVRWLIRQDLPQVIECDFCSYPSWTAEDIASKLHLRNTIGMVAECGSTIVGYMVYSLHKDHLNVIKLVVHPDYRRRGVGTALFEKLKSKLSHHRRTHITFVVHELLLGGQLFLKKMGAVCTKILPSYFDEDGVDVHDGYLMIFRLPKTEPRDFVPEFIQMNEV